MKKVNLWKTLFLSALAVAAFTGCSDDDPDDGGGMPSITVNGQGTTTLSIGLAGGTTEAVTIESSGDWTMTVTGENGADASACTPSLSSGSKGTKTVTFDLTEAATPRTYTVKVTTSGTIPGIGVATDVSATIKIEQTDSYVPTTAALYSENCGTTVEKDGSYWPYADAFTGWTRGGTLDQSGVTYGGNKASVRNSGKDYDPTDDEKAEVSGYPYAYINGSQGLDISNINVGSNSNFTFTFTALNTVSTLEASPYTPTFGDVTASTLKFSVNPDGSAWMPVEITTKKLGTGSWYLCTAMFKLPASVSTDKISVRFDSYSGGASLRLDDFKLYEGGDGTELTPEVPTSGTISQITEPGTYELSNVTVVNRSDIATIVADATGYMMIYGNNELKVGDKVNVAGPVTIYQTNPLQFNTSTTTTLEVVSSDNSWDYTFTEYSVEDVRSYFNDIKCIPIQLAGTIVQDGKFYNLMFDGESNLQGSIQYYTPDASVLDVPVLVKGYAVGQSKSGSIERIKIFPYEITVNSSAPYITATAPATFKAEGETIEVSYAAGNLGSNKVFAKLEDNEAGQFSVGEVADGKVSVTAKANEGAACQAKLVLYIAASEGGEALAQTSVTLKQSAKQTGDDTRGTYESMSIFVPTSGSVTTNPAILGDMTVNEKPCSGFKLGTGSKTGTFTSAALGVSGSKKLAFYAVGWKGTSDTQLTITVENGGSANVTTFSLTGYEAISGNPPFKGLTPSDDTDYFIVELSDLTPSSTITFQTTNASKGRAVVFGIQLF